MCDSWEQSLKWLTLQPYDKIGPIIIGPRGTVKNYGISITGFIVQRPHMGKNCSGKAAMQTFLDSIPKVNEKMLDSTFQAVA
jgi:hypothetical protein